MLSRPTIALAVGVLAGALCAPPAFAQFRGGGGGGRGFVPSRGPTYVIRGGSGRGRAFEHARGAYIGSPWFVPPYYPDEGYEEGAVPPSEPPVQVVYLTPPAPPPPPSPPPESLLLVSQGGQWVRVPTGNQIPAGPLSNQPGAPSASGAQPGSSGQSASGQTPAAAPKTVLVFRDGHREVVDRYVIQGDTIYASSEYWRTGSWTTKIPISQLDVPATVKANEEAGTKFDLPSGPNEVVVSF
jgi:hypothetical protein